MYILLVNANSGENGLHEHKQRYCDKVIDHGDHLVIWYKGEWEIVNTCDFTSYSVADEVHLTRGIKEWEWERWHDWNECSVSVYPYVKVGY